MHTIFIKFSFADTTYTWLKKLKICLHYFFFQIDLSLLTPNELIRTIIFLSKIEERWKIFVPYFRNPFMDKKFDYYR